MKRRKPNVPFWLFVGLSGFTAIATGLFGFEAWLLARDDQYPMTYYIRNNISWRPRRWIVASNILSAGLAAAITHFIADEHSNRNDPPDALNG